MCELISRWVVSFFIPVLRSANRIVWAAVLLLPFFPAMQAHAQAPAITVVLSEHGGSYAKFSEALRKALSGKGVAQIVIAADKPIPTSGLVIGVGMKAASVVAASKASSVLNVLISRAGHEKLLRDFPRRAGSKTFSAIFLDQPAHRQAQLVAAALPNIHSIGLLYSSRPEGLDLLKRKLHKHGIALIEQRVDSDRHLSNALHEILDSSDALLVLPDDAVYNSSTVRNIMLASYRARVPLIGFSPSYVNAGALCAVFSTQAQIAAQVVDTIRKFGDTKTLPPARYPHDFEVMLNEHVASSMGLKIKNASALHYKMESEADRCP